MSAALFPFLLFVHAPAATQHGEETLIWSKMN